MYLSQFNPIKTEQMKFELYEWFTQVVLEDALWKKCENDEISYVCINLGNQFEKSLDDMSDECLKELFYETFQDADIDI